MKEIGLDNMFYMVVSMFLGYAFRHFDMLGWHSKPEEQEIKTRSSWPWKLIERSKVYEEFGHKETASLMRTAARRICDLESEEEKNFQRREAEKHEQH